jgi:hypothetical protein
MPRSPLVLSFLALAPLAFFAASILGCSDSPGSPMLPDASRIATPEDTAVATDSPVVDAPDADSAIVDADDGAIGPSTFTDIYRDIIQSAPPAVAQCQNIVCHGAADHPTGLRMGATKDDAYKAITTFTTLSFHKVKGDPSSPLLPLVKPGPTALADSALLIVVGPEGSFYMPLPVRDDAGVVQNRKLDSRELRGIEAWLKRGAAND